MSALTDAIRRDVGLLDRRDVRVVQVLLEEAVEHLLARVGREHALRERGRVTQVPAGRHRQHRVRRRRPGERVGQLRHDLVGRQLAHAAAAVGADLAAVERVRRLDQRDRHPLERRLEVGLRLRRVEERQVAIVLRGRDRAPEQPPPVLVQERLGAGVVGGPRRARQDRRQRRPHQRGRERERGVDVRARQLRADLRRTVVVEAVRRDRRRRQRQRPLPLHLGEDVRQRVLQLGTGQSRRNGRPSDGPEQSSWKFGLPLPAEPVLVLPAVPLPAVPGLPLFPAVPVLARRSR